MAETAVDAACGKLGIAAPCRTSLLTLDGRPVTEIPAWPRPSSALKKFLRTKPLLRELHALSYLGASFAGHLARRAAGLTPIGDENEFRRRYQVPGSS
jgi:hypothetical protein